MPFIKPTVGRVVYFATKSMNPGDQPLAAVIAKVHTDERVNLAVFDENGAPARDGVQDVLLYQGDGPPPWGTAFCVWMPFQVGQAAKTEDVTAKLAARVEQLERMVGQPHITAPPLTTGEQPANPAEGPRTNSGW